MNLTGRSLRQYQLLHELGAGGMGVVYRARDTVLGRDVAVKVLPADKLQSEETRQRFHREARAASALNHPNVITIYEIGSEDGIDFIAMEYVDGQTLQALLRQRRLRVAQAAGYAHQIAGALVKAHAAGVVHRDIKPSNIVITADGLVKVLDFGLARLNETAPVLNPDDPTVFATRAGAVLGTIAYMSPEQARGEEAGPQSDIFSLGIMLFEMLSGQLPFSGASDLARLHSLHVTTPMDVRSLSPDVPEALAALVARMLEKDLDSRCLSMAEVRRDIRPFAGFMAETPDPAHQPVLPAQPASALGPASGAPRRIDRTLLAASAVVIVLVGAWGLGQVDFSRFATGEVEGPADRFDPETAQPYELYGRARELLNRFDREGNSALAITLLERSVEKDPKFALGHATLTEAYRYRFKAAPDEQWRNLMAQSAQRAAALNPELGAAQTALGLVLMEQPGKVAEAEAHFRRAIELDPRNVAPLLWTAVLLSAAGQPDRANESLQRVLALDPNNWAARQELGLIHFRASDYAQAVVAWEHARQLSPDNARVLSNLAAAYHMLDRYEDAASTLQRAIEIEPAPRHYTNLGTLRFFQGRYADAIPPLEKSVELAPNRYLHWGNLADAYRWSPGHKGKARDTYGRAIRLLREQLTLKPTDPSLNSTLALYLAKAGDKAAALDHLSQFKPRVPTAAVFYRLAVAHELGGDRNTALRLIEQALKAGYAMKEIRSDPELVDLRNDIRYHKLDVYIPSTSISGSSAK